MVTANYHQQLRISLPVGSEYITAPPEMATNGKGQGPAFSFLFFVLCTWCFVFSKETGMLPGLTTSKNKAQSTKYDFAARLVTFRPSLVPCHFADG